MAIPNIDLKKRKSNQPHVVLLGAGASFAAFPKGDINGMQLPLMNNIVSILKLEPLLKKYGIDYNGENFEAFYSNLVTSKTNTKLRSEIEAAIFGYFSEMVIPDKPTLYDYLLLSLRKKDIIATFNWDPFLAQAYLRNYKVAKGKLPDIIFLHGNVAVGTCRECETIGLLDYSPFCWICKKPFELSKLLYPVKNKNYQEDDFIDLQWQKLKDNLKQAYMLTIFGYSAPVTDVEAISLMREAWQLNSIQQLAAIDVIDIKSERELRQTWKPFSSQFFTTYKSILETYLFNHPRRSCEALQMATLQQDPWSDNPYPKFKTLGELHKWIAPLVEEERDDKCLSSKGTYS